MIEYGKYESVNQKKQQMINRSLVINLLRREKICSRADLAKLSGLKCATITYIINDFMKYDLVIEDGLLECKKGRRSIGIRINGEKYRTIGVMITREYYSLGMMGLSGEVYDTATYKVEKGMSGEAVIEEIKISIRNMIAEEMESEVLAICVAVPGPYDPESDRLAFITNLLGWENIEIHRLMQEGFDIPVFVENDANAAVCAQQWFSENSEQSNNMVYIVAGQGIGCGIISNGELQRGYVGSAGEIGHTSINYMGPKCECGNRGCLEKYCSSIAIMERVKERIQNGENTCLSLESDFDDFTKAVRAGDTLAKEEFKRACECLSVGIVNLVNQVNPREVIIGDVLADVAPEIMLCIIRERVKDATTKFINESLIIEHNKIQYNPILIGAGTIAAQKVLEDPIGYIEPYEITV